MEGQLPHNEEYEQTVLGNILCTEGSNFEEVRLLKTDDFYFEKHQIIFQTLIKLKENDSAINVLTLRHELDLEKKLDEIGDSSYLTYLMELSIPGQPNDYFVDNIRQYSTLRKIWGKCQNVATKIENGKDLEEVGKSFLELNKLDISDIGKLKPVSAKMLESIPPPQSLWGNIIYEQSITQINAVPGIGKTTLGYNLCGFGALGQEFLDLNFSKKIKSLVVDLETPFSLRRHKLEMICRELPENMYFLDYLDIKNDLNELIQLTKREQFDLIIFDTQSRVLAMGNENDNSEGNFYMGLLRRLVNETGSALILMHHTTKSDETKGVYRGRGASAISGAVDVVVNIEGLDQDTIKLKVEKTRFLGPKIELLIRKSGEDRFERHYAENGPERSGFEVYDAQSFILSLEKDCEWQTKDICQYGIDEGFQKRAIERALSGLHQSGKIKKPRHGVYIIQNTIGETDTSANTAGAYPDGTVGMTESIDKSTQENCN